MEIIFVDQICYSLVLPKVSGREMRSKVKIKKRSFNVEKSEKTLTLGGGRLEEIHKTQTKTKWPSGPGEVTLETEQHNTHASVRPFKSLD